MAKSRTVKGKNSNRARTAKLKNASGIPRNDLQDISLGLKSRTTSDIKAITARDRASQKESQSRQEMRGSEVTPEKGSNTKYSTEKQTRDEVINGFVDELQDRRWQSADLVEHAFGDIISGELAASVALHFLHSGILTVLEPGGSEPLERSKWPEACITAVISTENTAHPPTGSANVKDRHAYIWKWSGHLDTGSESGAETFFNTVGIAAYAAAGATNVAGQLDGRKPTVRFTTLPRQHHALPLPNLDDRQDCRPDFFALPASTFVPGCPPGRDSPEFLEKQSPLAVIHTHYSQLLEPYRSLSQETLQIMGNRAVRHAEYGSLGAHSTGKTTSSRPQPSLENRDRCNSSKSVEPVQSDPFSSPLSSPPPSPPQVNSAAQKVTVDDGRMSSLFDFTSDKIGPKDQSSTRLPMINIEQVGKNTVSGNDPSDSTSTDTTAPIVAPLITMESILKQLQELHTEIIAGNCPSPPEDIQNALLDYSRRNYLDLSYVCVPNLVIPGEDKLTKIKPAIVQLSVYMRQQRRAQSWLRYSYGLIATSSVLGLLRADATGVEECIFDKETGCGMISAIRLALGITLATGFELGNHPSFTLRWKTEPSNNAGISMPEAATGDKRSWHPDLDDGEYGQKNTKKARGQETSMAGDKLPVPREYRYREANSITLFNNELHPPSEDVSEAEKTVYYIQYLLEDRGSLIGSLGRIWCVYRELGRQEKVQRGQDPNRRVFEGPYALKMFYIDIHRSTYKLDILGTARSAASAFARMKNVIVPTSVWYLGKVLSTVRGFPEGTDRPKDLIPSGFKNREEIVVITPLKRTLGEFTMAYEFYLGILDAIRGIIELAKAGNILLAEEDETLNSPEALGKVMYIDENDNTIEIILVPRPRASFGGLHDLEMVTRISKEEELILKPKEDQFDSAEDFLKLARAKQKLTIDLLSPTLPAPTEDEENSLVLMQDDARDLRTGTPAFKSIRVLETGGTKHNIVDDMQSLFYVIYLSMFTFNYPRSNSSSKGLNKFRPLPVKLPDDILRWAEGQGSTRYNLAREKDAFFQKYTEKDGFLFLKRFLESAQPFWTQNSYTNALHSYVLKFFHEALWYQTQVYESENIRVYEKSTMELLRTYVPRKEVDTNQILKMLEDRLEDPVFAPLREIIEDPSTKTQVVRRSSRLTGRT